MGQYAQSSLISCGCAAAKPGCLVLPISPNCRCNRRWRILRNRYWIFSRRLAKRAKPYAQRDLAELKEFASRQLGLDDLQPWDVAYASEKLRVARYAFSDQEVKQYFPEHQVLEGMFRLVETLYGLQIKPDEAPRWQDDVRFFSIRNRSGVLVGQFYLDLYARPSKRGGAWMDDAITRRRKELRRADARGLSQLQFLRAFERKARPVHARRGDHAVS